MTATEHFARALGERNVLTLDMGGTSADVGILVGGAQRHTTEYEIEWGLPGRGAADRHQVDRRRRRLDRLGRRGRVPPRRATQRRSRSRADLLRPRRHAADGDRREPAARPAQPRVLPRGPHAARSERSATRWRRSASRSASRRSSSRRRSSRSRTRTWRARSRWSRSSGATTRAASRCSPSAAPGRSTPRPSRGCWASRR